MVLAGLDDAGGDRTKPPEPFDQPWQASPVRLRHSRPVSILLGESGLLHDYVTMALKS